MSNALVAYVMGILVRRLTFWVAAIILSPKVAPEILNGTLVVAPKSRIDWIDLIPL